MVNDHETLAQCCVNVGPPMPHVCWAAIQVVFTLWIQKTTSPRLCLHSCRRKQDDPYPLPTRTRHFCQPVPYTNPYPIPTRTIYLTHVMRGSAAASGQAARARAAGVSTRDQRWSVRLQTLPYLRVIPTRTIYWTSVNTLLVPYT